MLASIPLGELSGHAAGRILLKQMYEQHIGGIMPEIAVTPRGKPYFADSGVHFSISHTKCRVFCVLSDRPVGVDAEETHRKIDLNLAEKILSETEKERFAREVDKRSALLKLWVLKEANAKCAEVGANMTYLELSTYPGYMDSFVAACFIPHTDRNLFPNSIQE